MNSTAGRDARELRPVPQVDGVLLWLVLDIGIVIGSYALALWLRFDGDVPGESWRQLAWAGPLIGIAYILAYQLLGVYRTAWQYGSARDALMLAVAVAVVTAAVLTVNLLLPKRPIPLTVNVVSAAFIFLFHAMLRMLPRVWSAPWLVVSDPRPRPSASSSSVRERWAVPWRGSCSTTAANLTAPPASSTTIPRSRASASTASPSRATATTSPR